MLKSVWIKYKVWKKKKKKKLVLTDAEENKLALWLWEKKLLCCLVRKKVLWLKKNTQAPPPPAPPHRKSNGRSLKSKLNSTFLQLAGYKQSTEEFLNVTEKINLWMLMLVSEIYNIFILTCPRNATVLHIPIWFKHFFSTHLQHSDERYRTIDPLVSYVP